MVEKKICAIVLNYNGYSDTIKCVDSIINSEVFPEIVVVVDNCSIDESILELKKYFSSVRASFVDFSFFEYLSYKDACDEIGRHGVRPVIVLLGSSHNGGYASGNNLGLSLAMELGVDACWILNNDTVVSQTALKSMCARLFSSPDEKVGLCGSLVCYADGSDRVQCCGGGHTNIWTGLSVLAGHMMPRGHAQSVPARDVEKELNFIYGASVMVSRSFLEEVGLMDERFFLYCEEQDWAWRGFKHGFRLGYAPDAVVYHSEGATTGMNQRSRTLRRMLQLTRSRILLAAKHKPLAMFTVVVSCAFAALRLAFRSRRG